MAPVRAGLRRLPRRAVRSIADQVTARRHLLPPAVDSALDAVKWAGPAPRGLEPADLTGLARGHGALLVGPANFAGQGWQWARAYERATGHRAASWMFSASPTFAYPADYAQPIAVNRASRSWQRRQLAAVTAAFDAVVIEAGRPLFGSLLGFDPVREAHALRRAGVAVSFLWHGSDIRLPSRHAATHPTSPYRDTDAAGHTARLESVARRNRDRLSRAGVPGLVSTPDLLADLPGAVWCPVVVDVGGEDVAPVLERDRPVVVHVPSNPRLKGSDLVRAGLRELHDAGLVEYREAVGLPSAEVLALYRSADIVLDQFRLGIYGVAACEAMAAGRLVLSSVDASVRERVLRETGTELPVLETPAHRITDRIREVLADRERHRALARAGRSFVRAVHDGRRSAQVLLDHAVGPGRGRDA